MTSESFPAPRLRRVPDGENGRYRDLLLRADDSSNEIDGYINEGTIYLWQDPDEVLGHVLVTETAPQEAELKNLAVDPGRRGTGIGQAMIAAVLAELAAQGISRVLVATSAADAGNLHFYQRCGFRLLRVERDVFLPARGYPENFRLNGILAVDQVVMDRPLSSSPG